MALLPWRTFECIGTLRLLMCRNEGVIVQKHLVTGMGERTSLSHPGHDKPAIRDFACEVFFAGMGN